MAPILALDEQDRGEEPESAPRLVVPEGHVDFFSAEWVGDVACGDLDAGDRLEEVADQILQGASLFRGRRARGAAQEIVLNLLLADVPHRVQAALWTAVFRWESSVRAKSPRVSASTTSRARITTTIGPSEASRICYVSGVPQLTSSPSGV